MRMRVEKEKCERKKIGMKRESGANPEQTRCCKLHQSL
jgi:hypothetical protein